LGGQWGATKLKKKAPQSPKWGTAGGHKAEKESPTEPQVGDSRGPQSWENRVHQSPVRVQRRARGKLEAEPEASQSLAKPCLTL